MLFKDKNGLALFFLVLSIIILLVNPFLITSPIIDNLDPSSYVIVPIIMLPLLAVFMFKSKLDSQVDSGDIAIGICLFAVFIALIVGLQLAFPYQFLSYRADMLILPLAVAAISIVLFGAKNIGKFWALILYPALASPLLFLPALDLNNAFAQINTLTVYGVLHLFAQKISYVAPFTITTSTYAIGIGTACAGIAVFVALVLFLIPIAYLLEGKLKNKIYWVASGFVLLLALNFIRMAGIGAIWLLYGPNATVGFVHSFVGILLFYLSIIVIILLAGRYGLGFPKRGKERRATGGANITAPAVAIVLSLAYLLISSNYTAQIQVPIAANISYNFSSSSLVAFAGNFKNVHGWSFSALPNQTNLGGVLALSNSSFNSSYPIILLLSKPNQSTLDLILNDTVLIGKYNFVDQKLVPGTMYEVSSNDTLFYLMVKPVPFLFENGSYGLVTSYIVMPQTAQKVTCARSYDGIYTSLDNLILQQDANQTERGNLENAYCLSSEFV
ncbi:MAG: exosortase/archaeosortase family protein [Candidatus Micrarchaeota archaeon]|nr:exosortase/archaeosortase family protein [Candidatus Micrarchaeota archaeon]